jgi:hypothetical protein
MKESSETSVALYRLQITQFEVTHVEITFLNAPLFILLAGMKAQLDQSGGRILLGDNAGGGAAMLWPISVQCAGVTAY